MIFKETKIKGLYIIEVDPIEDERGFFARTWCKREFQEHGLMTSFVQTSISFNKKKGTLRGMHYQVAPNSEMKLVRCTAGKIHDVVIDLRPDSVTYKQHVSACLSAENRRMLYIPEGFAHGFQTMEDHTEVLYQISEYYTPEAARGVRWNDPEFGIDWPAIGNRILSDKDMGWPDHEG